ncbi:MAG TPA: aminoglycoside phosphotransferase family protein [Anaerolineales bacterium]|nr:aminoglycoside phosphotransferase family protein [Anaerolineales bacterium]
MPKRFPIPDDFRKRFCDVYGAIGAEWLATLPERVEQWQARLDVRGLQLVPGLSYNLVFFGQTGEGAPIVLKAAPEAGPLASEAAALNGFGVARAAAVLTALPEEGLLLTERLQPGRRLSEVATEREALDIVAGLFRAGWPAAPERSLDDLATFTRSLERAAEAPGQLDGDLLRAASVMLRSLLAAPGPVRMLHGDLHYDNILTDAAQGYRLIDPKGLRGDPGFDLGYLVSRTMPFGRDALPLTQAVELRLRVLTESFAIERGRLAAWAFVAAALSAAWTQEDHGDVSVDELQVLRQVAEACG